MSTLQHPLSAHPPKKLADWSVMVAAAAAVAVFVQFGPMYGFAALLLAGALGIVCSRPDLASAAVVFALFANLAPVIVRSHGVPYAIAVGCFALLLVLPALYYLVWRREPVRVDAVLGLMFMFLLVQVASVIGSDHARDSIRPLQMLLLEGLLLYFLLLNAVRTREALRRCLWGVVLAGGLLGSLSLLQNVTANYDSNYGGLALTRTASGSLEMRSSIAAENPRGSPMGLRAMGPIGDSNYYAQLLLLTFPVALLLAWAERRGWLRLVALISTAVILAGIVLTFSRGAAVALVALVVALVVLRYVKLRYALTLAAVGLYGVFALSPDYAERVRSLAGLGSGQIRSADRSLQERATLLRATANVFLDHPILGVGVGQSKHYISAYATMGGYSRPRRFKAPHNSYLELLSETGILGLLAFLAIVFGACHVLWKLRRYWLARQPENAHLLTALLLAIAGFLVTSLFLDLAYLRFFWGVLALSGVAAHLLREQAVGPRTVNMQPPNWWRAVPSNALPPIQLSSRRHPLQQERGP